MDRRQGIERLDLDDHQPLDDQIEVIPDFEDDAIVDNRNRTCRSCLSCAFRSSTHRQAADRIQQPRPEHTVHGNGGGDDLPRYGVQFLIRDEHAPKRCKGCS